VRVCRRAKENTHRSECIIRSRKRKGSSVPRAVGGCQSHRRGLKLSRSTVSQAHCSNERRRASHLSWSKKGLVNGSAKRRINSEAAVELEFDGRSERQELKVDKTSVGKTVRRCRSSNYRVNWRVLVGPKGAMIFVISM
jgi:mRNA-degrading endonuclease RelE of RelBE toxin-antitoxin system